MPQAGAFKLTRRRADALSAPQRASRSRSVLPPVPGLLAYRRRIVFHRVVASSSFPTYSTVPHWYPIRILKSHCQPLLSASPRSLENLTWHRQLQAGQGVPPLELLLARRHRRHARDHKDRERRSTRTTQRTTRRCLRRQRERNERPQSGQRGSRERSGSASMHLQQPHSRTEVGA